MQKQMTIGQFAQQVGASISGVRRWCEIGLLTPQRVGRIRVFGAREVEAVKQWRQRRVVAR